MPTARTSEDPALSSRKRKADDFEWEASKENVMPLKRGRNVVDLNQALRAHDSVQTKLRLETEMKTREAAIAAYAGDDPLAHWLEYVRWLEVQMPEDTRKKFKVLEKCTRELKDDRKYRNDMRYVRLCIQYADLVSNPKDIFRYLYQNKIGERVSLFYIGWAYVLETMANYPQAHKIYLKASQKKAEPQDLLERKYKEFQRRMSRQWLRMNEETGADDVSEREQLHQHHASARAQRVQKVNAHKPVFTVYEDPVVRHVDPFCGNGEWKKLGTMQQQDKENELAPSAWNPLAASTATGSGHNRERLPSYTSRSHPQAISHQVFVDDEFSVPDSETKRQTPLTHRSQTLRQRMEGVATEEEMLARKPLKNFTASEQKTRVEKQAPRSRVEQPCYDVKQTMSDAGEAVSFEEVRARAYKRANDRHCPAAQQTLHDVSSSVDCAPKVTAAPSISTTSATGLIASHGFPLSTQKPAITLSKSRNEKPIERGLPLVSGSTMISGTAEASNADHDDMTINTRVALEDINKMFCSPPKQPKDTVWEVKEDDPVERKLHFSVYDDSVDSISVDAQDQSLRQDTNESIPTQPFQVFTDDVSEGSRMERKIWSQKRKPLGIRDDLVRVGRLTNKDALVQAEKDVAAKKLPDSGRVQDAMKYIARDRPPRHIVQPTFVRPSSKACKLDPYTHENRQALILDQRVDRYLWSRPDAVKTHTQKLPRFPCNNPAKRKLRKPVIVRASHTLTLQLVEVLGSGSFAHVFSANVVDAASSITFSKAIKFEKERQNLAWEFYVTNKIIKILRNKKKLLEEKIPVPALNALHLFPNGALLMMDQGRAGTLYDVLNRYKQSGVIFPEVLAVYYTIRMLRCIELVHSANVLHGDIKPDNWLMISGYPSLEFCTRMEGLDFDKVFHASDLYLIDYGRSIDLSLYSEGTVFTGNCHVKGFQCVEMLTQRPWTHQIDTFAFCATVHCMLFGDYMEVKPLRDSKSTTTWGIVRPFKRYWHVEMWKHLFHALLNVSSCTEQPSLSDLRKRLENYFVADTSRQQELVKQLSRQDVLLGKPMVKIRTSII
uniref:BUB protein kinase n=1 Tax=Peronospora matthiolae TaxID=2874970 RepID=A0AAV1UH84_9STRA